MEVAVSYDGAYQKRGGKSGGEFARYCFAAAISVQTGKVLTYEIACSSCRLCVEKQQALKGQRISLEDYRLWLGEHGKICQAKEYGNFNSVALESQLAPIIFSKAIRNKLLFSTVIADGDDRSVNLLVEKDVYGEFGISIRREECLSFVQKRIRMHLIEKQKDFIASNKTSMQEELNATKSEAARKKIRE